MVKQQNKKGKKKVFKKKQDQLTYNGVNNQIVYFSIAEKESQKRMKQYLQIDEKKISIKE